MRGNSPLILTTPRLPDASEVPWLLLRGGYRYVWGDASTLVLPVAGLLVPDSGQLRRNVGIGGFTFHPNQKIVLSGEVEAASGDQTYFRTSLNDYQKMHARARYQTFQNLSFSADFSLLRATFGTAGAPPIGP